VKLVRQRPGVKRSGGLLGLGDLKVVLVAALEIAAGVALTAMLGALLVLRRVRRRSRRRYELYELHLSTHDQAKPQDLEDMVESIANIIRAFPAERVRDGQPYVALELISGQTEGGTEWSVNIRCEPSSVRALDAAISATYPDVRIGRKHSDPSRPRQGVLRVPGCVMRFRKRRSFVYPLLAAGEKLASPPLEQIARAQVELGEPSIVRFQLTPTAAFFEDSARRAFRRHERRLVRREHSTPRPAALSSTLDRSEMQNAGRAQNRSLFWLETVIAADTTHACKTIAAAVQSRRGENRLHRRIMVVRQRLYRRRFPLALGPLIPSMRCLVSAAEVAHLLELPTARMKGVPVRRTALPRIPAPPNILRAAPGRLDPVLRAENAQVAIAPADRKYGVLLTGGQGSGKSAALLALYLNDCKDPNAAPLVIDPKSELSRLCLKFTRPNAGKTVWYLDLGHPGFGMNPLRLSGDRPLPVEAGAIADNIVAALLDINANQIYQSSRRYLYHAVIGAIALAHRQDRRAKFEDVYNLLLPTKTDIRAAVAEACSDEPDLDQTAEFFAYELPHELQLAGSATAQRLDAPRNKVSLLLQVPSLRRWFSHPTDIPLREIIDARDVLLIDANMGAIGEENSKACMHFLLRLLHTQMQRQVHLPETDRPRVPLLIDEAHYVMGAENVIDQFATHRRAGLEPACAIQYFSQLGSGSEHAEKIRKGVLNLLQSRLLFRIGDADDAEQATRIAMAVYSTMIHDDPDSRARLRVTPEQLLNFPNYHCLASWIADGTRAPCFIGQTYPWATEITDASAQQHLAQQTARVAPYPERLDSTLDRTSAAATDSDTPHSKPPKPIRPAERDSGQPAGKREVQVDYEPPPEPPRLDDSPVRRVVGRRVPGPAPAEHDGPAPDSLRELAFLDRINEIGPADQLDGAANLPRLYNEDYAIVSLLDRAGLAPRSLIGRAVLPGRVPRTVTHRLTKLYRHGLIAQHSTGLAGHAQSDGTPPLLYSLTRRGLEVAQRREPPAISRKREWRAIEQHNAGRLAHDLHALAWAIELHRTAGKLTTDHWRTARYATGRYPVPQTGIGRDRHPIALSQIPLPDKQTIIDLQLQKFAEIHPDVSLELRIDTLKLTFDLLVELDLTSRPSYNHDKLLAYDAFLCGWSLVHPRYRSHATRPVVVFVCTDARAALALAREADQSLTGRIGIMGTPAEHWYYAGRDHMFFAIEREIHHGNLAALALPPRPPGLRERLTGDGVLELSQVQLLHDKLLNH
jgi:hypothetical protein